MSKRYSVILVNKKTFPEELGPFGILPTNLRVEVKSFDSFMYSIDKVTLFPGSSKRGSYYGHISPKHQITLNQDAKKQAKIPEEATAFAWAYPLFNLKHKIYDPEISFCYFGGFVYLNSSNEIIRVNAIGKGSDLHFGPPTKWDEEYSSYLIKQGRFQSISIAEMKEAGARYFCWINPHERLKNSEFDQRWEPCEHGGFVYLFSEPGVKDPRNCYFCVTSDVKHTENDTVTTFLATT